MCVERIFLQVLSKAVDDYNPWGKPGHGAPNDDGLRKRKIFTEPPTSPWKVYRNYYTVKFICDN